MTDIIFGACLLFCVPTCYLFWRFIYLLQNNEDDLFKKLFDIDLTNKKNN